MTELVGRLSSFAFKKASAWGTAVAVGAGDGFLPLSDNLAGGHAIEHLKDESLSIAFSEDADVGLESISGDITAWLRYQGVQELLLALAMGAPATKTGAGPYEGKVFLSSSIEGLFGTYVFLLESAVVAEAPSVKISGFDLSADFGNPVQVVFHAVADRLLLTGDADITNTTTETDAITVGNDAKQNRVIFDRGSEFRINAEGDAALDSGDLLGISGFNLKFNRPHDSFYTTEGGTAISEPLSSGPPEITFSIKRPEFDSPAGVLYKAALKSDSTFKASLTFAKGANFSLGIYFPRLKVIDSSPSISGPGRIPNDITFQALQATAAPTGLDDAQPFYLVTSNNNASAPF